MKRFYTSATATTTPAGTQVLLDGKPIRTPLKAPLLLPTAELGAALAQEWTAQVGVIDPKTMPLTRHANTVIDHVARHRDHVVQELAAYGQSDLLCYRAEAPAELVQAQARAWDPLLAWAAGEFAAPLQCATGIMPRAQDALAVANLHAAVAAVSDWTLAPLHTLVTITGSLAIGLAVVRGVLTAEAAWAAAQVDAEFQIATWGRDADADAVAARRAADLRAAAQFVALIATAAKSV